MKKLSILLFLTLFLNSLFLNAESRVALVIGNSNYSKGYLSNPQNDAAAIAEKLKKLNFKVVSIINGNRSQMNSAISSFKDSIAKDCDVALFFYSGHGTQINGNNYLLPLGEIFEREDDFENNAVSMNNVLSKMSGAKNKIVILDACRDNPFEKVSKSSGEGNKGLAVIGTGDGDDNIAIIYATLPGKVADNGDGKYSPFTESLLNHIEKPIIMAQLFSYVNVEVANKTKNRQKPRSEFGGEASMICLAGKIEAPPPVITNNTTKVETPTNVVNNTTKIETPTVEYKDSDLTRKEQNGKYGFVDKTGKVVIPFKYDDAYIFSEGLAPVKLNNKWGYIDKTGEVVIPFKYNGISYLGFQEGVVAINLNYKFGFIDKTDKVVIPFEYQLAYMFREGLASVKLNNKWGFIDKAGREVIPFRYDDAYWFDNSGKAKVALNGREFYIDKNGKEIGNNTTKVETPTNNSVVGQKTSKAGYIIEDNLIIFTFNPKDYPAGFDEIEMVTVAGEFNQWDAGAKNWQMTYNKNGIWYFVSTKSKIVNGAQFKFVVNGKDWQQPDSFKVPRKNLADDGYGGFNLKVLY